MRERSISRCSRQHSSTSAPRLQADGGDLVLLGAEDGKVSLQLVGACGGCPLSTMTLTAGIERILRDRVPGVTTVEAI